MSCLPCFGKKKAEGGGDEQAASSRGPMMPPPAVQAPAVSYGGPGSAAPVAVAATSFLTPTKPPGGTLELSSSA